MKIHFLVCTIYVLKILQIKRYCSKDFNLSGITWYRNDNITEASSNGDSNNAINKLQDEIDFLKKVQRTPSSGSGRMLPWRQDL